MRRLLAPLRGMLPDRASLAFLVRYFRDDWLRVSLLVIGSAGQSLLLLPSLWLTKYAIDHAIPDRDVGLLLSVGAAIVGLRILAGALALLLRWDTLKVVKRAIARIRIDLLAGLYGLKSDAAALADASGTQSRIVNDTERLDRMCGTLLSVTLPASLTVALLLIYLASWNLALLALAALVAAAMWLASHLTARSTVKRVKSYQRAFELFNSGTRFLLHHRQLTRARAAEAFEIGRQRVIVSQLAVDGRRMAMGYAIQTQLRLLFIGLIGGVLIVGGGIAIIHDLMTFGALTALYLAAGMLGSHGSRVADTIPDIVDGGVSLRKLHQLSIAGPVDPYSGQTHVTLWQRIDFEDVGFGYGAAPVMNGVSLSIARDSNILIVGRNGAGKTTLLHLLFGFERPDSGRLTVDGTPYDALDLRSLRATIGLVPQHPDFFAGTVRDNLLYGIPEVGDQELDAAVRLAEAGFIFRLPNGYDTEIGEGGRLLSGGERQLLAIARAILMRPLLLVLDEPTNHLDMPTIERLMRGLAGAPNRPALLVISHDPAVVAFAENIFELTGARLLPRPSGPLKRSAVP